MSPADVTAELSDDGPDGDTWAIRYVLARIREEARAQPSFPINGHTSTIPDRPFARLPVRMPVPGPDVVRLSRWSRLRAWLRYRPASWPLARVVRR